MGKGAEEVAQKAVDKIEERWSLLVASASGRNLKLRNIIAAAIREDRAELVSEAERALEAIIIRCKEGDKRSDWLPIICSIAERALEDARQARANADEKK